MDFELRHLRYFLAVAEELHFGRAARRLGMAQPPLSQQIAALERILEVQLFSRSSRQVRLTPAGVALLPEARRILGLALRAAAVAGAAARGETGVLTVGMSASSSFGLVPPLLREFRSRHPTVEVVLRDGIADTHLSELATGVLDVALVRGPYETARFRVETVQREPVMAVVPADHALAGRTDVLWGELKSERFVLFPRSAAPPLFDAIIASCSAAGFVPEVAHETSQWLTVSALVAAGVGVGFAPASAAAVQIRGVEFVGLSGGSTVTELSAVWRPDDLSPLPERFVAAARSLMSPANQADPSISG
jgi:DNA-binding transcriptional LysR family regulator